MWRGLYTAAAGMITESKRTDVIANNLANSDTAGFKRDVAVTSEFEPMFIKRLYDHDDKADITAIHGFHVGDGAKPRVGTLGTGSYVDEVAMDASQGNLQTTGNPLDVAIAGEGYFAVQTQDGVRYTRDGAFFKDADGVLRNTKGLAVLNQQGGVIRIPQQATRIGFGAQGQVYADNQQIGQLQVVAFDDPRAVLKQGDNLFYAQEGAEPRQAAGEVQQGMLERSNANVISEMVELINNQRIYEANSKAVLTQDTMLEASVTQVGRMS